MKHPSNALAVIGRAIGGILGMAGTMTAQQNARGIAWGIDGTSVVVAAVLLALCFFRKNNDAISAGFLVYAIGEAVMLGGTAGTLEASIPAFAAGTAMRSAGLFFVSVHADSLSGPVLPASSPEFSSPSFRSEFFWENALAHCPSPALFRLPLSRDHFPRLDCETADCGLNPHYRRRSLTSEFPGSSLSDYTKV